MNFFLHFFLTIPLKKMQRALFYSCKQCCQPPIFSADICAKSESNPECLRKSLHQTNPILWILFSTKPFLRQNHEIVKLQLGHVIIGMIPATASMHKIQQLTIKILLTEFEKLIYFATPDEIVKFQLGHVIIGMIPAAASMHKIHAIDHKNIVNKSLKSSFISPRQTERETEIMDECINSKHKQPFSQEVQPGKLCSFLLLFFLFPLPLLGI